MTSPANSEAPVSILEHQADLYFEPPGHYPINMRTDLVIAVGLKILSAALVIAIHRAAFCDLYSHWLRQAQRT